MKTIKPCSFRRPVRRNLTDWPMRYHKNLKPVRIAPAEIERHEEIFRDVLPNHYPKHLMPWFGYDQKLAALGGEEDAKINDKKCEDCADYDVYYCGDAIFEGSRNLKCFKPKKLANPKPAAPSGSTSANSGKESVK